MTAPTVAERLDRIHEGRVTRAAGAAVAAVASGADLTDFDVPFDDFTGDVEAPTVAYRRSRGQWSGRDRSTQAFITFAGIAARATHDRIDDPDLDPEESLCESLESEHHNAGLLREAGVTPDDLPAAWMQRAAELWPAVRAVVRLYLERGSVDHEQVAALLAQRGIAAAS